MVKSSKKLVDDPEGRYNTQLYSLTKEITNRKYNVFILALDSIADSLQMGKRQSEPREIKREGEHDKTQRELTRSSFPFYFLSRASEKGVESSGKPEFPV